MGARVTGGLWLLFLAINAVTFGLYGVDKRRARRGLPGHADVSP